MKSSTEALEYGRRDAKLTSEVYAHLDKLPPPPKEWLLAHPDRWYIDNSGRLQIFKS